jgi:hypothetical protein
MMTGQEMAGNQGGTMNHTLTRIGRRVVAIIAECNYAATRVGSLRNTPEHF